MMVKIFFCHHENDARYCNELSKHLRLAERNQRVELWSRRLVQAGQDFRKVVDEKLEQASLILVLMSADLIACDYCWGVEVSAALQRHRAGRARLIPVIVRACDWKACFSELRQVPAAGTPLVTDSAKIDDARFLEAATEIMNAVRAFTDESTDKVTDVTSMADIITELRRLEEQSQSSVVEATEGLLRLSAGLRYLEPSSSAIFFADHSAMARAIPENALAPLKRVYVNIYNDINAPFHSASSQAALQGAEDINRRARAYCATVSMKPGDYVKPTVRLVSELGSGGMGSVWLAENMTLSTYVAVKLMMADHLENAELRQRFKQEAQILARIQSPHVVQVLDYGETAAGVPYILMELLDGETLGSRLKALGPLPLPDVVQVVTQVASALSQAHSFGIVHRDLKPDNIFLIRVGGELFVKVIDFGIAKLPQADLQKVLTATGQLIGTHNYMPPEQMFNSRHVDHRTDVWALAAVAYEALTGRRPFQGKSFAEVVLATDRGIFTKPTALQPGLPDAIDTWAERALKRDPAARFGTVREAADAFKEAVRTGSLATTAPPVPEAQPVMLPSLVRIVVPEPSTPPPRIERPLHQDEGQIAPTLVSGERHAPSALAVARREGKREGRSEGRVEEAARAVLTVFRARGIVVQDAARDRILAEKDPGRLERWLEKAATAPSVNEVLNEPI
jgi:eukaryotic-like serine/threonine-protein kinase